MTAKKAKPSKKAYKHAGKHAEKKPKERGVDKKERVEILKKFTKEVLK